MNCTELIFTPSESTYVNIWKEQLPIVKSVCHVRHRRGVQLIITQRAPFTGDLSAGLRPTALLEHPNLLPYLTVPLLSEMKSYKILPDYTSMTLEGELRKMLESRKLSQRMIEELRLQNLGRRKTDVGDFQDAVGEVKIRR